MKKKRRGDRFSRREFCGLAAAGIAGAATPRLVLGESAAERAQPAKEEKRSTVAIVRDPKVWQGNSLQTDPAVLRRMVDRAVCLALGADAPNLAWGKIVHPSDVVGLKVNCLGGAAIATRPDFTQAVVESLLATGVAPGNIIIWDRGDMDLRAGRYALQKEPGKVRCLGSPGTAARQYTVGSIQTSLSTLVAETCSLIISLPALKTHNLAGFSGALKNNMGAIPNPVAFHVDNCAKAADLHTIPLLREKVKLVITDALQPQFDRGPGPDPASRWKYAGILASIDPAAHDRVGISILEEKRALAKGTAWPMSVPYMKRAAELGIGQTELSGIKVCEEGKA